MPRSGSRAPRCVPRSRCLRRPSRSVARARSRRPRPARPTTSRPAGSRVPFGRVNVLGGNLLVERRDLDFDTRLGNVTLGAVWNSADAAWRFAFEITLRRRDLRRRERRALRGSPAVADGQAHTRQRSGCGSTRARSAPRAASCTSSTPRAASPRCAGRAAPIRGSSTGSAPWRAPRAWSSCASAASAGDSTRLASFALRRGGPARVDRRPRRAPRELRLERRGPSRRGARRARRRARLARASATATRARTLVAITSSEGVRAEFAYTGVAGERGARGRRRRSARRASRYASRRQRASHHRRRTRSASVARSGGTRAARLLEVENAARRAQRLDAGRASARPPSRRRTASRRAGSGPATIPRSSSRPSGNVVRFVWEPGGGGPRRPGAPAAAPRDATPSASCAERTYDAQGRLGARDERRAARAWASPGAPRTCSRRRRTPSRRRDALPGLRRARPPAPGRARGPRRDPRLRRGRQPALRQRLRGAARGGRHRRRRARLRRGSEPRLPRARRASTSLRRMETRSASHRAPERRPAAAHRAPGGRRQRVRLRRPRPRDRERRDRSRRGLADDALRARRARPRDRAGAAERNARRACSTTRRGAAAPSPTCAAAPSSPAASFGYASGRLVSIVDAAHGYAAETLRLRRRRARERASATRTASASSSPTTLRSRVVEERYVASSGGELRRLALRLRPRRPRDRAARRRRRAARRSRFAAGRLVRGALRERPGAALRLRRRRRAARDATMRDAGGRVWSSARTTSRSRSVPSTQVAGSATTSSYGALAATQPRALPARARSARAARGRGSSASPPTRRAATVEPSPTTRSATWCGPALRADAGAPHLPATTPSARGCCACGAPPAAAQHEYTYDEAGFAVERDGEAIGWDGAGRTAALGSARELRAGTRSAGSVSATLDGVAQRRLFGGRVRATRGGRPARASSSAPSTSTCSAATATATSTSAAT